jgi:hypothetical protein
LLDEVDHLLDEGLEFDKTSDWLNAQELTRQNQAFFSPNYEETRIDVTYPMRKKTRKIFTNF